METKSTSIFRSWINVLTQPGEETFEQEGKSPNATLSTALMWILVAGLVSAIVSTLSTALLGTTQLATVRAQFDTIDEMPQDLKEQILSVIEWFLTPAGLISSFVLTIVFTILMFLLGVALTHLLSKMFGGKGSFGRTAYLQSLFVAPVGIVSALLGMVPFAGGCLAVILAIYNVVLWFFSTKVEHNLTTGKTIGVAVVAGIVFLAFFACIGGVVGVMVAGTMGV